jgi:hypothetical protein
MAILNTIFDENLVKKNGACGDTARAVFLCAKKNTPPSFFFKELSTPFKNAFPNKIW